MVPRVIDLGDDVVFKINGQANLASAEFDPNSISDLSVSIVGAQYEGRIPKTKRCLVNLKAAGRSEENTNTVCDHVRHSN